MGRRGYTRSERRSETDPCGQKGGPTEWVWYYDLSDVKVTKKQPLTLDRFED